VREERALPVPEQQNPTKEKPKKRVGTDAFNLEYEKEVDAGDVRKDIETYLLEYRLRVQEVSYKYIYGRGEQGEGRREMRSDGSRKSLVEMSQNTIADRMLRGLPTHREYGERDGAESINLQMENAQDGDVLLWASPPGPKNEGYGKYGFLFVGVVKEDPTLPQDELAVHMKAIRLEDPSLAQYNQAWAILTGESEQFTHEDIFLSSPTLRQLAPDVIGRTLREQFDFSVDQRTQRISEQVLKDADKLIDHLVQVIQHGTDQEKITAFRAVENYTLYRQAYYEKDGIEQKRYQETRSAGDLATSFGGYAPPAVEGSCGASNMLMGGGNMFVMNNETGGSGESLYAKQLVKIARNSGSDSGYLSIAEIRKRFPKDQFGERYTPCPECNKLNIRPDSKMIKNCLFIECRSKKISCETEENSSDLAA
jgi:hypothetical protein